MSIEFGISSIYGLINGVESGCVITTGGVDGTAVVASGFVFIGGQLVKVSGGHDLDLSAASPKDANLFIFAKLAAGQSSTATLDATSVDPRPNGWAVIGIAPFLTGGAANSIGVIDTSAVQATALFGRAQNCTVNLSYDQAIARGGSLVFGNDMKMYNGALEGSLENAEIVGQNYARIFGGAWASGGAGSGTMTLSATQTPIPFAIKTQSITNGVTSTITLLKCYSTQLGLKLDRENYTIPSLSFQAIANSEGDVITWNI